MNLKQLNSIGSGAYFPIQLETVLGEDGKPEMITTPEGKLVEKISWKPLRGDLRLIKQNIIAILTYQIGQRFRQEHFGSRTWECIEEPNTETLAYVMRDFIKQGIGIWEPRVSALDTQVSRNGATLSIFLRFAVRYSQSVSDLTFDYNLANNTTNAY